MKNTKSNLKLKEVEWLTTLETFLLSRTSHPKCVERFASKKINPTPSEQNKSADQIYRCTLTTNLFEGCVQLLKEGATRAACHRLSLKLRTSYPDLKGVPKDYDRFCKRLKIFEKGEVIIVNGGKGSQSKATPLHVEDIRNQYADPKHCKTQRGIARYLNRKWKHEGLVTLSRSIINEIIDANRNIWDKQKFGKAFLKETRTRSIRIKPEHAMTMVQMDGSPWNEPFNGWNRFVLFQIIDVYSDRVVGLSIGESENSLVVLDALKSMCELTGYLPGEIASDNSSAYNTQEFVDFQRKAERYGTIFTRQRVGNSPGNSQVESAQKDQQVIAMDGSHFIGLGARTKLKTSRKSDEVITELSKPRNQPLPDEVKRHILNVIVEYNNTAYEEWRLTPNQLFAQSEKPHAIKLEPYQIADLFWKGRKSKVSVEGMIKLTINKVPHHFMLNPEDSIKYAGRELFVRYDEKDMGEVFGFTISETPVFLFVAEKMLKFRSAKIEQDEGDGEVIAQIYNHNIQKEKIRDQKAQEQIEAANRQRQLMGELGNWMSMPKNELKKTQEDAAMVKYMSNLHKLDDSSSKAKTEMNNPIELKEAKKVKYSLKIVD